ncbi:mechanosensitive ion channel family protein [Agaribacterium haliotis]|uniref:mechanosensitive ion channel family protein n=1 Tax=Agaribacterium haliotis TaxID=2013869 RepID=UPI000BB59F11|nr:mechanosensitive ion channel domain-containing protein [Agaribacterium haliotis]
MSNETAANPDLVKQAEAFFADGSWIEALIPFFTNVGIAIVVYIVGIWIVNRFLALVDKAMSLKKFDQALQHFVHAVLSMALKFVVVLVALDIVGIPTTSLLAVLGAAGLAIGLALKDSLSNFASGVMLIVFKPFRLGDFVEAGGTAGVVEKITVFNTIFRSPDNKEIIVPNAQIYGGTIVNVSAKPTRRVDLVMGISYDDDMKKARQLMLEVIEADERVLKEPEPVIAVDELADSSVNFVVRPWCKTPDYWAVKWDLTEAIKEKFDNNGITIPYPQQDVYMHQNPVAEVSGDAQEAMK